MGQASVDADSAEPSGIADDLAELRGSIDEVDRSILERLNERARLVTQVGALKRPSRSPVYVAGRERDLVVALQSGNPGPFPSDAIPHVFREIVSATRSLEEVVRVAFLGPVGTFSHQATVRQFGAQVELCPASSLREVFSLTERGKAHFGVVPVENTTEGAVNESFDALVDCDVTICGELLLEVSLTLLSKSRDLSSIRLVASHPSPLGQCRLWLQRNLPGVETVDTASTAAAAEAAANDPSIAAIGSEVAAAACGLHVLERGIEDLRGNTTRFVVIGREIPAPCGNDLTSACFTLRQNESGALHRMLEPFARHRVNLTSIQSRPMKGKSWEYVFFVDMNGHLQDEAVAAALADAAEASHSYKVLGSYPRAQKSRDLVGAPG